jgi:3-isopropylmalate dehydrogenase
MKIAVLAGDGIGSEVTAQAVKVLHAAVGNGVALELTAAPIGGVAYDQCGEPLPAATLELARRADAILFGAAGVPGDEKLPYDKRPGAALLRLRKDLDLFANYRPAVLFPELADASSMKPELVAGLDLMILRELTGDLYFGEPRGYGVNADGAREAFNTMRYAEPEIERIGHVAFRTARARRRRVCSVDKANVLETMELWRDVMTRVGREYPDVELTHLFVDAALMQLLRDPKQFDVMVMGNMFGDILSDGAAMLTGSLGMLPSASLSANGKGLYEPVHGSAPDIAGRDIANPLAAILSAAMMLRHSFGRGDLADDIEAAVRGALAAGYRTADIYRAGTQRVGTRDMGDAVVAALAHRRAGPTA